jgi:hypothetical protein
MKEIHGIENLTIDSSGAVRWLGEKVDQWPADWSISHETKAYAIRLAQACRDVEYRDPPLTRRKVEQKLDEYSLYSLMEQFAEKIVPAVLSVAVENSDKLDEFRDKFGLDGFCCQQALKILAEGNEPKKT